VTYFALLNSLIPLSLVVTLEIVRFVQAAFMEWDETFYHEDKEATATTSNLNDELALVDYVFSMSY
jgi:phospholipid-transporting ATPase